MTSRQATQTLTGRQRECLRLLGRGRTPKEIATELDLSVETIHAHLKAARRALGVTSSRQAALLIQSEERPQPVGTHGLVIGDGPRRGLADVSDTEAIAAHAGFDDAVVSDSWATTIERRQPELRLPGTLGGRLDDLTPFNRAVIMMVGLFAVVIVLAGLAATATSLQQMLWSIYYGR